MRLSVGAGGCRTVGSLLDRARKAGKQQLFCHFWTFAQLPVLPFLPSPGLSYFWVFLEVLGQCVSNLYSLAVLYHGYHPQTTDLGLCT